MFQSYFFVSFCTLYLYVCWTGGQACWLRKHCSASITLLMFVFLDEYLPVYAVVYVKSGPCAVLSCKHLCMRSFMCRVVMESVISYSFHFVLIAKIDLWLGYPCQVDQCSPLNYLQFSWILIWMYIHIRQEVLWSFSSWYQKSVLPRFLW